MQQRGRGSVSAVRFAILLVVALTVASHICTMPESGPAYASPTGSTGSDQSHDGHAGVHLSACEALESAPTPGGLMLVPVVVIDLPRLDRPVIDRVRPARIPAPFVGPPGFLLHGPLLV